MSPHCENWGSEFPCGSDLFCECRFLTALALIARLIFALAALLAQRAEKRSHALPSSRATGLLAGPFTAVTRIAIVGRIAVPFIPENIAAATASAGEFLIPMVASTREAWSAGGSTIAAITVAAGEAKHRVALATINAIGAATHEPGKQ